MITGIAMRRLNLPSVTLGAVIFGAAAFGPAPAPPAAAALVNENLITTAPPGYQVGFQDKNAQRQIVEWVPAGETVENWTEMVTVQIFHGLKVTPEVFMRDLEKRWDASCPGAIPAHTIANVVENGYPSLVWLLDCPKNPATGKPEITWLKAVQGSDSFLCSAEGVQVCAVEGAGDALGRLPQGRACVRLAAAGSAVPQAK